MSNNKSSFWLIYCSHVKPNNHHLFITIGAHAILVKYRLSCWADQHLQKLHTQNCLYSKTNQFPEERSFL